MAIMKSTDLRSLSRKARHEWRVQAIRLHAAPFSDTQAENRTTYATSASASGDSLRRQNAAQKPQSRLSAFLILAHARVAPGAPEHDFSLCTYGASNAGVAEILELPGISCTFDRCDRGHESFRPILGISLTIKGKAPVRRPRGQPTASRPGTNVAHQPPGGSVMAEILHRVACQTAKCIDSGLHRRKCRLSSTAGRPSHALPHRRHDQRRT